MTGRGTVRMCRSIVRVLVLVLMLTLWLLSGCASAPVVWVCASSGDSGRVERVSGCGAVAVAEPAVLYSTR